MTPEKVRSQQKSCAGTFGGSSRERDEEDHFGDNRQLRTKLTAGGRLLSSLSLRQTAFSDGFHALEMVKAVEWSSHGFFSGSDDSPELSVLVGSPDGSVLDCSSVGSLPEPVITGSESEVTVDSPPHPGTNVVRLNRTENTKRRL